jgi:hypothetical protein
MSQTICHLERDDLSVASQSLLPLSSTRVEGKHCRKAVLHHQKNLNEMGIVASSKKSK